MRLIIILFALVVQVLSKTIDAKTTSGRLLGTEADGGMLPVDLGISFTELTHWISFNFQRHRKIPATLSLEQRNRDGRF